MSRNFYPDDDGAILKKYFYKRTFATKPTYTRVALVSAVSLQYRAPKTLANSSSSRGVNGMGFSEFFTCSGASRTTNLDRSDTSDT